MSLNSGSTALIPVPAGVSASITENKQCGNRLTIIIAGAIFLTIAGLLAGLLYYFLSLPSKASIPTLSSPSSPSPSPSLSLSPSSSLSSSYSASSSSSISGSISENGKGKYKLLGCYYAAAVSVSSGSGSSSGNTISSPHVLSNFAGSSFNVARCFQYALLHKSSYFGLERGTDCYVGSGNANGNENYAADSVISSSSAAAARSASAIASSSFSPSSSSCDFQCSDGSSGPCGGDGVISLYSINN